MPIKRIMLLVLSIIELFLVVSCSAPQSNSFTGGYVGVNTGGAIGTGSDNTNG